MDKQPPCRLPRYLLILLAVCACGLAVHFTSESLGPVNSPFTFDLAQHAGHAHDGQEYAEEAFLFPAPARLPTENVQSLPSSLKASAPASPALSPLLPPPNS